MVEGTRAPSCGRSCELGSFADWPNQPPPLNPRLAADVKHDGLRLRRYDFVSEDQVELRLWLMTAEKVDKPTLVVLNALDEAGWQEWIADLGPAFKERCNWRKNQSKIAARFARNVKMLQSNKWAFAAVTPRGIGPDALVGIQSFRRQTQRPPDPSPFRAPGPNARRPARVGRARALACLRTVSDLKDVPLWLQGKNEMAGIALYASLFEPDVVRLDLWHPPASHRQGPIFLNVLRILDMPQAVALAAPRKGRALCQGRRRGEGVGMANAVAKGARAGLFADTPSRGIDSRFRGCIGLLPMNQPCSPA